MMRHKIKGDLTSWNSSVWEFGQLMKDSGGRRRSHWRSIPMGAMFLLVSIFVILYVLIRDK